MTITLGRATGLRMANLRRSSKRQQLQGLILAASADELDARRQQLQGLPGEEVVPLTSTEDPTLDGFYSVRSVDVERWGIERSGSARFSADLERVANFAAPHFETIVGSIVRTNVHSVTAPPGILTSMYAGGSYAQEFPVPATYTWTLEDGSTKVYGNLAAPRTVATWQSFIRPADYYKSGCKIEVKYGSTWYPIHGDQVPIGVGTNWRISNGAVRLYPTSVSGNGRFTVEQFLTGAAWTGREFGIMRSSTTFENATTDSSGNAAPVTVLLNRPEVCSVRVKAASGGTGGLVAYDCTIRRGNPFVEVAIAQQYSSLFTTQAWGIGTSAVVAMTSFTGGARATANDANGLRAHIASPLTTSKDLVNGYVYLTSAAATATFSVAPDYVWGATAWSDTAFRDLYFSSRYERQRVVPR